VSFLILPVEWLEQAKKFPLASFPSELVVFVCQQHICHRLLKLLIVASSVTDIISKEESLSLQEELCFMESANVITSL
jgi:hypothetical protein